MAQGSGRCLGRVLSPPPHLLLLGHGIGCRGRAASNHRHHPPSRCLMPRPDFLAGCHIHHCSAQKKNCQSVSTTTTAATAGGRGTPTPALLRSHPVSHPRIEKIDISRLLVVHAVNEAVIPRKRGGTDGTWPSSSSEISSLSSSSVPIDFGIPPFPPIVVVKCLDDDHHDDHDGKCQFVVMVVIRKTVSPWIGIEIVALRPVRQVDARRKRRPMSGE